ncbi:MAG: hypothetical protein ACYDHH_26220 [Solirubrobacteraceae bacterium]
MATVNQIALYDRVELLEPVYEIPAGARGAVLEFHGDGDVAMLEILAPADLGPAERIVFAPVSKLRRVG